MSALKSIQCNRHFCRRPRIIGVYRSKGFSTAAAQSWVEDVTVPCGSNGNIELRIHGIRGAVSEEPPPVILCLSGGPLGGQQGTSGHGAADFFARKMPAIAVEIHCRIGSSHQCPTPVHDMLFGYDWVLKHLVPKRSSVAPGIPDYSPARMGLYGEGLGGGLAITLALTECHSKGHRIAAAAVHEPLLNWTAPEELELAKGDTDSGKGKRKKKSVKSVGIIDEASLAQLVSIRREAFSRPEHWFDPFMSPMMFFRSSNVPIPSVDPSAPVDEFAELAKLDQEDFMRQQLRLSSMSLTDAMGNLVVSGEKSADTPLEETQPPSPRKSARRYPRIDSGLTLPNFRITTAPSGLWHEQADEFTTHLRRSMIRTDELKREDMTMAELHAEERAIHEIYEETVNQEQRLSDAVDWFGEII